MFVGLDFHEYGSLKLGRFQPAMHKVALMTETYDDFSNYSLFGDSERRSGQIYYSWNGHGVQFDLSLQTAKDGLEFDLPAGGKSYLLGNDFSGSFNLDVDLGVSSMVKYTTPRYCSARYPWPWAGTTSRLTQTVR